MEEFYKQKTEELKAKNLFRQPKGVWEGSFVDFSSNDYLGLRTHEKVVEAAISATWQYGAGAGASRLAGGNHPLFDEFEEKIAAYKGYEAACVFGSGYLANIGVIQALVGKGDAVLVDRLSHACIIDGVRLSGAKLLRFKHNDVDDAKRKTQNAKLIITEEIFSMDGDVAPEINIGVPLMVDGAHSLYNKSEIRNQKSEIYIGTMSKALGSYGGYVCGSKTFIEYIKTSARSLIYSTALPPSALAAAIAALDVIATEKPYEKTLENVEYFLSCHSHAGGNLKIPACAGMTAIIPIIIGSEEAALTAEAKLKEHGLLVSAIRPPTVPAGTARLRISISASHTKAQLDKLAEEITKII